MMKSIHGRFFVLVLCFTLGRFHHDARCDDADANAKKQPSTSASWRAPLWQLITSKQRAAVEAERQAALAAAEQAKMRAHRDSLIKQRDKLLADIKQSVTQIVPRSEAKLNDIKAMERRLSSLYEEEMKLLEHAAKTQSNAEQLQDGAMRAADMISQARKWMQSSSDRSSYDPGDEELRDILSDMNRLVDRLTKWGIKTKHRAEVAHKNADENTIRLAAIRKRREAELKATQAAIQQALAHRVAARSVLNQQNEEVTRQKEVTIEQRVANVETQLQEIKQLLLDLKAASKGNEPAKEPAQASPSNYE